MARGKHSDADDYCDACRERVANHETDHGLLCDECKEQIYGKKKLQVRKDLLEEAELMASDIAMHFSARPECLVRAMMIIWQEVKEEAVQPPYDSELHRIEDDLTSLDQHLSEGAKFPLVEKPEDFKLKPLVVVHQISNLLESLPEPTTEDARIAVERIQDDLRELHSDPWSQE